MHRWTPYPANGSSRQPGDGATEARLLATSSGQPIESSLSQLAIVSDEQVASSSHTFHTVNATDSSNLHLGDAHYHSSQPELGIGDRLLSSLHFPQISVRYDNIDDPHSDTLKWIFESQSEGQPKWHSFLDWLNGDGGPYWISGKPGSGKSVLMKYLATNFQTSARSDDGGVVSLSFWFWEAAHTDLERNMLGCLRALLWQALREPDNSGSIARAIKNNLSFEWTKKRLRDALHTALNILLRTSKQVLIFLDGLDECGPDATEMIKFAIGVAKNFPELKICLSSRPEPIFLFHLECYPHSRMQDLNEPDVVAVVRQDLFGAPQFVSLQSKDWQLQSLEGQLIREAQGVLLWVRIVTQDLLRGIAEGDTFPELKARLQRLPSELDGEQGLYAYMLRRNASSSKSYLADAALYCQLASRYRRTSVLDYCLAVNDDLRAGYLQFQNGWKTLHHQLDCDRLSRAINARTGGLLEVVKPSGKQYEHNFPLWTAQTRDRALTKLLSWYGYCIVQFIHRTARSYILDTTSGQEILAMSRKSSLDVEILALETWLISRMILPCLESVAPMGGAILQYDMTLFDHELLNAQTQSQKFKSVFKFLATNGYLWLESYLTRPMNLFSAFGWSTDIPFTTTFEGQISFATMLAACGHPSVSFNEFQRDDLSADSAQLLCMTAAKFLYGGLRSYSRGDWTGHTRSLNTLLSHQPDQNHELIDNFGEIVSVFHYIWVAYSNLSHIDPRAKIPAVEGWLLRAKIDTKARRCMPTMIECNSLFFISRSSFDTEIFLLGDFVWKDPSIFSSSEQNECVQYLQTLRTLAKSSRVRILGIWDADTWKPRMYVLSNADFQFAVEQEDRMYVRAHCPWMVFWAEEHGDGSAVPFLVPQTQDIELKSLMDMFRYLGKSEAQIKTFIALEEPRIRNRCCEIIYRRWREWLYGVEEPYLEKFRGIKRPCRLDFSV